MSADKKTAEPIEVTDELSVCPSCGYADGFHVAFVREGQTDSLRPDLICPNCSTRYTLNRHI